jgi:hypothetical protein
METVALWIIWAAAPPATLIVLLYAATAPWWRSSAGRALMTSKVALALLIDLSLLFHAWHDHLEAKEAIALVVYALICAGSWLMFLELVRAQVLRRRSR